MRVSLAAMRANAEMNQNMVAKAVCVDVATLRKWEKRQTSPTYDQLMKLCEIYQCTLDDLNLSLKST